MDFVPMAVACSIKDSVAATGDGRERAQKAPLGATYRTACCRRGPPHCGHIVEYHARRQPANNMVGDSSTNSIHHFRFWHST